MTAGHEKPVSLPSEAKRTQCHVTYSHTHTQTHSYRRRFFYYPLSGLLSCAVVGKKTKSTLDYIHESTTRGQASYWLFKLNSEGVGWGCTLKTVVSNITNLRQDTWWIKSAEMIHYRYTLHLFTKFSRRWSQWWHRRSKTLLYSAPPNHVQTV